MNHFKSSSAYYDLLYSNKDYKAESEYIHRLIQQYSANARSVLNLGCGTGKHDFELAKLGYTITGVDLSPEMIAIAKKGNKNASDIQFFQGNICDFRFDKKFDTVISMFNVLGYQTNDKDMIAVFETAKFHLNPGGIFIFDIWHSPAVYKHPPEIRVKRLSDKHFKITRIAEPTIHGNVIDVDYEILVEELKNNSFNRITETHHVRHFSIPEIKLFAEQCRFSVIRSEEFLTSREPNSDTWGISYILKNENI